VTSYKNLGKDISSFVPPGKNEAYVNSFRKSMGDIAQPILTKAREFEIEAKKQIVNSLILSRSNSFFLSNPKLPVVPQFFSSKTGVLMDRGGKQ
ncbi:MAG: hypothetical protein NXH75_12840, partial [Halobacteriovoraceae bacterium]|nr:hypothetical protein [Halobacteriovoraceae bacterium]